MSMGPGHGGQHTGSGWSGAGNAGPGGTGRGQVPAGPAYGGPGYQAAAYGRAQLRATDADRDWTVDYLNGAFTQGRLSKDEHDTRVGHVLAAQTYADLDLVLADLRIPRAGPPPTNSMAIASLVCGVGQFALGPLPTIPAIVLGHMARRQIRQTGEIGDGMALGGLILGWCGAALTVIVLVGFLLIFVAFAHTTQSPPVLPGPG